MFLQTCVHNYIETNSIIVKTAIYGDIYSFIYSIGPILWTINVTKPKSLPQGIYILVWGDKNIDMKAVSTTDMFCEEGIDKDDVIGSNGGGGKTLFYQVVG